MRHVNASNHIPLTREFSRGTQKGFLKHILFESALTTSAWSILHYRIQDLTLQGVDFREQACNAMHILSVMVTSKAVNSFQSMI